MSWYLPPESTTRITANCEKEIDLTPVVKLGAKYIIPSGIVGILFKEAATQVASLPLERFVSSAQAACQLGYISMVAVVVLGIYKMAKNIDEQQNPPPATITITKAAYDKMQQDNKASEDENARLLKELDRLKQENAQLRCIIHNYKPETST